MQFHSSYLSSGLQVVELSDDDFAAHVCRGQQAVVVVESHRYHRILVLDFQDWVGFCKCKSFKTKMSCILTRNSRVEEEGSVVLAPRDDESIVADGQTEAVLGMRLQGKSRVVNDLHVHSIAEIGLMSLWNSRKKEILIVGV